MIGELCVWDIGADAARVVLRHRSDGPVGLIEAPNWLGSGAFLVNGSGRLWRAGPDGGLTALDLGPLTGCNNDHGISPDGRWLAFSDKTEAGESCVYVVVWDGTRTTGPARRVTGAVPSWFHGWTPDGTGLVYVGARGDRVVRPFACDVDGGAEWPLDRATGNAERASWGDGFDHVDGPDMTPDGGFVWFNAERNGAVDLWRVPLDRARPAGPPERMTDGGTVDWFPHPSPCGRHVCFIAYPAGTTGHPFGVEVKLCLMPQAGGPVRELARIFGGQGCLNVPSWAPDGSAFAFLRYVP